MINAPPFFLPKFQKVLILSLALWVVAGCSPDEGEKQGIFSNPLKRVSLQLQWVTQAQFAGYYVALDKGWYHEEGIDLVIKPGGPDFMPVDLVAAGTSDFGTTLLADLTVAIQKNKPIISIAQIQQANGLLLIAWKSSGIKTPRDFIGKKIGVWLGSWEAQFNALLEKSGISQHEVNIHSQGWSMNPFVRGELNVASAMIYNEYHMVLEQGIKPQDIQIIDYADYGLDFPGDVLFTSIQFLKHNPDLCVGMLRASAKGWKYAMANQEETVDIILKYDQSGVQARDHQLAMMKEITKLIQVPGRRFGQLNESVAQRMIDLLHEHRIIEAPVRPNQVYTTQVIDKLVLKQE